MRRVLILGNGISRLAFPAELERIAEEKAELWICNKAFLEWGRLADAWHGHIEQKPAAQAWREGHGANFAIFSEERAFTCPVGFWFDSGSTLLAQAYEERYPEILVAGFDFGGPDIYSGYIRSAAVWINRWRQIAKHYDPELARVQFLGHDHKPFLLSDQDSRYYYALMEGCAPHIPGETYKQLHRKWFEENWTD